MPKPAIAIHQISKSFQTAKEAVPVLKEIDLDVDQGDFLIIFGPSGCGKSTLLHIVLGLEPPNHGQVKLLGHSLFHPYHQGQQLTVDEDQIADFRKQHVGMVYQQTYWIKSLNVLNNVAFPLWLLGRDKQAALDQASQMLETVGMSDWADYIPTELSSGQQQRVNLARALITNPKILIADEPTGNLDYDSGVQLMKMLVKLNQAGKTIVMVTHDLEYLPYADIAVEMLDGRIKGVYRGQEKQAILKNLKTKKMELTS